MRSPVGRLLLKLSGESIRGEAGVIAPTSLKYLAKEIRSVGEIAIAIVIGGGNIIRGARSEWVSRTEADTMGMLATVLNAIALRPYIEAEGRDVMIQSAVYTGFTEPVAPRKATAAMDNGTVVLFAGGTGNPLVTTDTAAAIRAVTIGSDMVAKASNVSGVYTEDPKSGRDVRLLKEVTFDEFLVNRYRVIDQVAVELCREHDLPITVFDVGEPGNLSALVRGEEVGTYISSPGSE